MTHPFGTPVYPFHYVDGVLHCDSVPLPVLGAEFGTPLYVYSARRLRENYRRIVSAFAGIAPLICYSIKANGSLALLDLLRREGSGFDIVSGGELFRALQIGADPSRIVFAGVGKTAAEIEAALRAGVGWINVESQGELDRVNAIAGRLGARPDIAVRLRPDVEADTHRHIRTGSAGSKFGLPPAAALDLVRRPPAHARIRGAHVHIGSQLGSPDATLAAIEVALAFAAEAGRLGVEIDTLDIGGGFPVAYREDDPPPAPEAFAGPIVARLRSWPGGVHLEPGRSIVADTCALLTSVQYEKHDGQTGGRILIVDAGMHTLLRPALYDAYHRVWPVKQDDGLTPLRAPDGVAGPICESADFLARGRSLPPLAAGDLLAVLDTGAYGFSMASNYNAHPLPAEVLVEDGAYRCIRRRQTYADLIEGEVV